MKFSFAIALSAFALGGISMTADDAAKQCGELGVMQEYLNALATSKQVDTSEIRMCKEHPAGTPGEAMDDVVKRAADPEAASLLAPRACWHGRTVGCSQSGYCYKACGESGDGKWCWTAKGANGLGDWITCQNNNDCNRSASCGHGGCAACGCGCNHD